MRLVLEEPASVQRVGPSFDVGRRFRRVVKVCGRLCLRVSAQSAVRQKRLLLLPAPVPLPSQRRTRQVVRFVARLMTFNERLMLLKMLSFDVSVKKI